MQRMANNITFVDLSILFFGRNIMNVITAKHVSNGLNSNKTLTQSVHDEETINKNNILKKNTIVRPGSDSLSSAPTVELFNNYNKAGINGAKNNTTETEDNLPLWLVNMLNNSSNDLDWVLRMLDEAGVDKSQIPNLREMRQQERAMFRQMLKEQADAAKAFAEGLAEEAKMQRKMMEAFKELVQGQNPSPEGQQLLAQFAPMLLFIALLLKNDADSEEEELTSSDDKSDDASGEMQVNDKSEEEAA